MKNFEYNTKDKSKCWYNGICDHSKCGEDIFCERNYKMSFLVNASTMEGKQCYPVPLKPDSIDYQSFTKLKDIKTSAGDFVKQGKNLLIYSQHTGNGKTEWSKKILLSWFDSIWASTDFKCRGLFISMPKLMSAKKESISNQNDYYDYVNSLINTVDVIVWDEINYKDLTPFEEEYLLNVISQRVGVGLSNIYTTNYTLRDIEKKLVHD